jgi:hypothetical protein
MGTKMAKSKIWTPPYCCVTSDKSLSLSERLGGIIWKMATYPMGLLCRMPDDVGKALAWGPKLDSFPQKLLSPTPHHGGCPHLSP